MNRRKLFIVERLLGLRGIWLLPVGLPCLSACSAWGRSVPCGSRDGIERVILPISMYKERSAGLGRRGGRKVRNLCDSVSHVGAIRGGKKVQERCNGEGRLSELRAELVDRRRMHKSASRTQDVPDASSTSLSSAPRIIHDAGNGNHQRRASRQQGLLPRESRTRRIRGVSQIKSQESESAKKKE